MIRGDVYIQTVLNNVPRLLGLLNRNISSCSYGCFDREYWHYNTVDFACARKQEGVLTLTLLYLTAHEKNRYCGSGEMLDYIRAGMLFWTKIQNKNGSFNEWYPYENSFVVTSFSTYAVSESLLLIKNELPEHEFRRIVSSLIKAADWLAGRDEIRVMNQQTGAAASLLNVYLLTKDSRYLEASKYKISLLNNGQSQEGWFVEYGGPDIGYLSLAIDYLGKYYSKTQDETVKGMLDRALNFIKYFVQPNLVAGGEYTSRNTEYMIPHGFELLSRVNEDARLVASAVRNALMKKDSFPNLFDDRYLTYVGYTWLQAYRDANPAIDETAEAAVSDHFNTPFKKLFAESGLLVMNNEHKHLIVNLKKGASFRLIDKESGRAYSDSGVLVESEQKWLTSGWLNNTEQRVSEDSVTVSGNMWIVPEKSLTPFRNILLRLFQMTLGRFSIISLWMKERLRDILITKTKPSDMRYNRSMIFSDNTESLLVIEDAVSARKSAISAIAVYAKDTHIYVPSSRYFVDMKDSAFLKKFEDPPRNVSVRWQINRHRGAEFEVLN